MDTLERFLDLTLTIERGTARIDFFQPESGDHVAQEFPLDEVNSANTWQRVGGEICSWLSLMADEAIMEDMEVDC